MLRLQPCPLEASVLVLDALISFLWHCRCLQQLVLSYPGASALPTCRIILILAPMQVAKARLPAAVEAFLQDRGVSFRQLQPGLLEVCST